ncbi:MAG: L-seryl-tRNA(Sec) selenium transferase [Helicobacteraceae bacterium]|jgi:L-seryl-tRNA(Ser) seleniumtransferase|nr:L-seryl-tRNA(Sec) selenium transferase [Helicobacteraceae bacterium]
MPSPRDIPKVDRLLEREKLAVIPIKLRTRLIRETLDHLRAQIATREVSCDVESIERAILERFESLIAPSLRPLINATGIVVHTNLGRSAIAPELFSEIAPIVTGYCNLEYDEQTGKRGSRYDRLERLMREALGAEAALVVNNNAAAVYLILNTFALKKEAIISRGELVEIGGSFRIPETMRLSGAILREVGTTNKTRLSDYEEAIGENTGVIMKAHRSNFSISGFTSEVAFSDLIALAKEKGLIDYFDLGSGQFSSLSANEPLLSDISALNPSLVSFSGDKLFGGAQAGIIFGKKVLIDRLKKNQLLRALRVDKLVIAVLEATLRRYILGREEEIPTVKMIRATKEELELRAKRLQKALLPIETSIETTKNYVGGGAAPNEELIGVALVFEKNVEVLQERLRSEGIISRVENDKLYLETRTIFENDLQKIAQGVKRACQ